MKMQIVYIDDSDEDLKKYTRRFKQNADTKDRFNLITINVQQSLNELLNEAKEKKPELILLDYKFDIPKNGYLIGITGISLSTALRENFPETPIVFFTRKNVFHIEEYYFSKDILSNLDEIIFKPNLFKKEYNYINFLKELIDGYKKLCEIKPIKWNDIFEILEAPKEQYEDLKLSNVDVISQKNKDKLSVFNTVTWIRKILIKYPGILYDPIHAATFLGISETAFSSKKIQDFFEGAKYNGVFAPLEGRWWKIKLLRNAMSLMNDKEIDLPIQKGFSQAWIREKNEKIESSKCIFSGESPADTVCYILKKPVKREYSLSYRPDSRPVIMDEARVSFKIIRTSNEVDDELFYPLGKEILKKIREIPNKEVRD